MRVQAREERREREEREKRERRAKLVSLAAALTWVRPKHSPPAFTRHSAWSAQLGRRPAMAVAARAYKVNLKTLDGVTTALEVAEDQSILEAAFEAGLSDLPHDCKLGVCMNCAARYGFDSSRSWP